MRAAAACVTHNWVRPLGEPDYRSVGNVIWTHEGKDSNEPYEPVAQSVYDSAYPFGPTWYSSTWDLPAIHVVLSEPLLAPLPALGKARTLWLQVNKDLPIDRSWFPPGWFAL